MIRNLGQVAAIYIGSSAPRNTNLIWLDNTVVPFVFRAYDGSAWSELATHKWVRAYVDGWLVTLPPRQLADDGDYMLINSNNVNYKITVKDFVKSAVGNPLDFKGVIRVSADFPNPSTLEAGDMYVIITSPVGGTVTDPYSGKTFEDSEKIVWDEVTRSWESLGKINITVNLTTSYSETEVTIHSSAGKETTIQGATDQLAGVMLPGQYSWLQALSNGSIVPGDPSPLTPLTPAHKHNYNDIINRLVSQQGTGESTIDPMSQKATTDALNLKFDKASVLQVSGAATDKVMSQKAVTDALKTLSDDFNNKLTNYLPLSGGTMTGSINLPSADPLKMIISGSVDSVLSYWPSNNAVEFGNNKRKIFLRTDNSNIIHYINGSSYSIYDTNNLPDPATLSGNNTFTGNNTFQAGKFNVGPFKVTSSGSLLSNISSPEGSSWSRSLTFRANSDPTSSFIFGGYNSINDTSIGYAYIGIGDITYSTAQYRFYSNRLEIPKIWRLVAGSNNILNVNIENNFISLGSNSSTSYIISNNSDLRHRRFTTTNTYKDYIIWDAFNLPDPARLGVDQTFTGLNTFTKKTIIGNAVSPQILLDPANQIRYRYAAPEVSRGYTIALGNNNNIREFTFGGYYSASKNEEYAYLSLPGQAWDASTYKFYANTLKVPYKWSIDGPDGNAIIWSQTSEIVNLGRAVGTTKIRSGNTDLIHTKGSTEYIIWDKSNLPTPASTTDLNNYLPLIGGTLTGQLTIKQSVDIKLRLQSTDADNYCIIQAIDSQASQLGVFGYAGDKWAIGHNGTYYEIWDKYNLTNPVTYTTNTYNHATLTNKDGQYFTYIKAGTNGLLPHSQATLANGGAGFLGTSDQSFNAAYINNLHTNKITFGVTGPYITGSTSATWFLNAEGGAQKVATGGLYVGPSYTSDTLSLVPANGIYSRGIIYIENGIGFRNSIWTNDLTPNRNYSGYLQVLDAYDASSAGGPTNYGTVLQINSKNSHWANQLWFSGGAEASKNGLYYRHMAYNETTYGEWNRLLTNKDVNIIPTLSTSNPTTLPVNQIFYSEIKGVAGTPTTKGSLFSVQGDDEGIQLWASSTRTELYYRTKWTSYGNWIKLATTSDLGNCLTKTEASTLYYPYNGRGYLSITSSGRPVMSNNQGYAVKDKNGNEREVLWMGTDDTLNLGNTSQYTLNILNLRCTILTHNGNRIATQNYIINQLSNYLPLTGGTLTGTLRINSGESKPLIINNSASSGEAYIVPQTQGTTRGVMGWNASLGMFLQDIRGYTFSMKADGVYFGASSSTLTKLLTSADLSSYATQSWCNSQFAPLKNYFVTNNYASIATTGNEICIGSLTSGNSIINVNYRNGTGTTSPSTWYWRAGSSTAWANAYWGNLYMNNNLVATQSWAAEKFPNKTGAGASGTWGISISGNATTATTASKLGSTTIGGSAKPIYLSSGTPTACSATVGSTTVPVYMNAGTITQCSTTLGVSITGNAATATNATQLGGTAASSYVKANDNISRLTNDSGFITSSALNGYATQAWVNSQNFVKSTSTKKVTDIQPVDALPATQASGVLYLVFG